MEWTVTRIQLHALRRKLCRMLDQCEPCGQPEYTECRKCDHGNRMRELMKEIETTQKRDREERRTKKPVHAQDALPADKHKPVRFSANYETFDEWLARQKNPHSEYVRDMIALHEKYPDATRDELAVYWNELRRKRQRERAAQAVRDGQRFSMWHATFDDWLARQKKPYTSRVHQMIAAHNENPAATKEELARMIEEKRTERKRLREMKGEGQHGKIPS